VEEEWVEGCRERKSMIGVQGKKKGSRRGEGEWGRKTYGRWKKERVEKEHEGAEWSEEQHGV
jgi:hypothetical protein